MKVDNSESLEAYFDGELSADESSSMESQIQAQPEICKQLESFRRDSTLLKQFPQAKIPFDLSASILELAGKTQPCPFALAGSPIDPDIPDNSATNSSVNDESESVSISRDTENVPYEDDWKPPTIAQRICRAMLWPMFALMIALGMYITNPSSSVPVAIQTTPDESEIEITPQKADPSSDSISYIQARDTDAPEVDAIPVKNGAVSNSQPQITILCKIDAQKFVDEQWYTLIESFGVQVDKSRDPLEIKSWTVNSTSDNFEKILSLLRSAPGIISAQSENGDSARTQSEKTPIVITILLVADES